VRFHDQVGEDTLVKLMTDGVLLAEITRDRDLLRYDTLIIDEAHERSLNIDFLLGYLKQLLPRRPDLKVVITSATIDPERFAAHFDDAPIVEVSGRTFPVEVRYRPQVEDEDGDQITAICAAVEELAQEGPGDVLVFLSGEREIRDTADALRGTVGPGTEVLPLYARLSAAEQHRVFQPHAGRRVVLATNVAETSLTVPGIRYVVDPGTARISRYSQRTKVQRLPIERISQASATQRAGRCGRVAPGICIRLYEEEDLLARPAFTDPEILRTNLASVILQMTAPGLGDLRAFPFVDPPDRRNVKDGVDLLVELGALDPRRTTRASAHPGRPDLAQLPIDPRLARWCRGRPQRLRARRARHRRARCRSRTLASARRTASRRRRRRTTGSPTRRRTSSPTSTCGATCRTRRRSCPAAPSAGCARRSTSTTCGCASGRTCTASSAARLRQLELSLDGSATNADAVHLSLLAGLLSHVGLRDTEKREYLGARSARWALVPSSSLAKKAPRWVMAAELVETNRMWGRVAARVDPEWAEQVGEHLVKRSFSEPHWEKKQAAVMAFEKVTLYGVPLVTARKVNYGRIDAVVSRDLFLRHALVEGDWETHHAFFAANRELLDDVEELEHRARRRDIVVDDQALFDFYDARIPADVVSGRHFDAWWKGERRTAPDLLTFTMADLVDDEAGAISAYDYPDAWLQGELRLPLTYQFSPGDAADGVTVHVPLDVLNQVRPEPFAWQVPGLRHDLVTALIKTLPKPVRRHLVPAPDTARQLLEHLDTTGDPADGALLDVLERGIAAVRRIDVPREDWGLERVPPHLRVTFRIEDAAGEVVAEGKDLEALQQRLRPKVQQTLSTAVAGVERTGLRAWTLGTLEPVVHSGAVTGCPALVDEGDSVAVRVLGSPAEQRAAMWAGTRRLLLLNLPSPVKVVSARLSNPQKLALSTNPHGGVPALLEDCVVAAVDSLMAAHGAPAWDEQGFARLLAAVRADLPDTVLEVVLAVEKVLSAWHRVRSALARETRPALAAAVADMSAQLDALVHQDFVAEAGRGRLPDVVRYLQGIERRLDKLPNDPVRDALGVQRVAAVQAEYEKDLAKVPAGKAVPPALAEVRWMVEELRVSLFAQPMRTRYPVSEKRIYKALDDVWAG
jgi:ATP-dependent helicase HrpA